MLRVCITLALLLTLLTSCRTSPAVVSTPTGTSPVAASPGAGPFSGTPLATACAELATPAATPRAATPFASPLATARATPLASPVASPAGSPVALVPRPTPTPDPRVTAQLARGASDGTPVDPTTTFPPDAAKLYLVFTTKGLPAGTTLESVWIAEKVDADVPENYQIDRSSVTLKGDGSGDFTLSKPNAGFPDGSYRVELYRDGTLIALYPFTVT